MRGTVATLALTAGLLLGGTATALVADAGEGNGTSNSQGANVHGNAVSSGAQPQPSGN